MKKTMGKLLILFLLALAALFAGLPFLSRNREEPAAGEKTMRIAPDYAGSRYGEIWLAGGCFWGVEAYFSRMLGVEYTRVGYANGTTEETGYQDIGRTGHAEAVYVVYDPELLPLEELLGYFFGIIDPTVLNRQRNDRGTQYRTGIYYKDESVLPVIRQVLEKEQEKHSSPIVTEVESLAHFIDAEDYHQDYLTVNPGGYCHISLSDIPREKPQVLASSYPRPTDEELKARLTPEQYSIIRNSDTEYAFQNRYWDNKEEGLYVDLATGEPLFSSRNKYDSGSGWPSFTRPIQWDVITYHGDSSAGMQRIEVRSRSGDSHLGHLFYDGPSSEGGLRYCINSGALDFIPLDQLEERGYGKFRVLFPD